MIEIVSAELIQDELGDSWACWLQLTQGPESWLLPATAPGALAEADLQAYFDAREAELWALAQAKQYAVDIFERIPLKRLLKATALLIMDEFNVLRELHGLPDRTPEQIEAGIKAKLRQ